MYHPHSKLTAIFSNTDMLYIAPDGLHVLGYQRSRLLVDDICILLPAVKSHLLSRSTETTTMAEPPRGTQNPGVALA
jgi:hypothetical protein